MTSLGMTELLLIGVVLIVAVGPERLPKLTRDVGRLYGRMRRAADDLRRALTLEADRMDEEERLRELRRRRLDAERRRKDEASDAADGPRAQRPPDAPPEEEGSPEAQSSGAVEPGDGSPEIPPGFTPEDWSELPSHIRERIQRRRGSS